jgi:hypothetical protein
MQNFHPIHIKPTQSSGASVYASIEEVTPSPREDIPFEGVFTMHITLNTDPVNVPYNQDTN